MADKGRKVKFDNNEQLKPERKLSANSRRKLKTISKSSSDASEVVPPVVAIGASAGGLEALEQFFRHMAPDSNITFVVITHLNPDNVSVLPELLQRYTSMNVVSIQAGMEILPNHVYVLPPGKNVIIKQRVLELVQVEKNLHSQLPIDFFLRSLAEAQGQKAICVILSGAGCDGTVGLRALREHGGLIIVQTMQSASYDSMPKNAISTGLVDYVLPPEKMPEFIIKYIGHFTDKNIQLEDKLIHEIQQILILLRSHTGHDFSLYKPNTIFRRIQKRMSIQQITSMSLYIQYLKSYSEEVDILFKELLINVTNFFRDPAAFEVLKQEILTRLKGKPKNYVLRVWIPGCSTGEEAYSLAIMLQECMDILKRYFNVQIFGTDIDTEAIEFARAGIYPVNIAIDVSAERLDRFFIKENNVYKVTKDIRKMIIFAVQNIIQDPPFTKLDLLSCRNLLIYLSSELQRKIFPLFHYSLKDKDGLLFLGSSETIGSSFELFSILDKKWKIFEKKSIPPALQTVIDFPAPSKIVEDEGMQTSAKNGATNELKLSQLLANVLLEEYAPACVLIDDKNNLIYIHGKVSKYLEFVPGKVELNILNMVHEEIRSKLSEAIRKVRFHRNEVISTNVQTENNKKYSSLNLKVKFIENENLVNDKLLLVIFEEDTSFEPSKLPGDKKRTKEEHDKKLVQLEHELKYTKESLQTTIEELETANEELKSSNEELQSTNEELQSTNEEIETSKEELQSLNEELTTVNLELENRIEQLSSANDDIRNLLDNSEVATIFLDKELNIKRFTRQATEIINLIATDIGRPINHIVSNLKYEKLVEDAELVFKTLESKVIEVQDRNNQWYLVRILPYRTVTNIVDGVVVTFLNINAQKKAEEKIEKIANELSITQFLNNVLVNMVPEPMLILKDSLEVYFTSDSFYKKFAVTAPEIIGKSIYELKIKPWNISHLKVLFEELLVQKSVIENYVLVDSRDENLQLKLSAQKISSAIILLIKESP